MSEKARAETRRRTGPEKKEEVERGVLGVVSPPLEDVVDFVKTLKYVTPTLVAEKFRLRVSVAKDMLAELVNRKIVSEVVGSNRLRVYKPLVEARAASTEKAVAEAVKKPKKPKSSKKSSSKPQA